MDYELALRTTKNLLSRVTEFRSLKNKDKITCNISKKTNLSKYLS